MIGGPTLAQGEEHILFPFGKLLLCLADSWQGEEPIFFPSGKLLCVWPILGKA
jgi:hypothetical protein